MNKSNLRFTPGQRQRGSVSLIIAFMLLVIIGFAGLAIDSGRSYGVKARLAAASDAAAIAGAQGLASGANQAERIANAQATATRFFNMNYPAGFKGTTVVAPTTTVVPEGNGQWRVTVDSRATNPNTFMRLLGFQNNQVRAMAQTIRKDLDVMLVLDSSGSIDTDMPILKQAAKNGFVNKFIDGPGGDRLGLVSYASGSVINARIDRTITRGFNKSTVTAAIDGLSPDGRTATGEAMRKALDELRAVPVSRRSSLRVMLVFSDGAPNVFGLDTGGVNANYLASSTYRDPDALNGPATGSPITIIPPTGTGGISLDGPRRATGRLADKCNINRASRNLTENAAALARQEGVVVYTIGMGPQLNAVEYAWRTCGYGTDEHGSQILRRVANTADNNSAFVAGEPEGLYCFAADSSALEGCFEQIASDILRLTM